VNSVGQMSRAALGAFVQEHLRARGIDTVLSGGACVSIYSNEQYVSMDLDLIHTSLLAPKRRLLRESMEELGFAQEGRYFRHEETEFFIEFPKGPPAVGEEPVKEIIDRHEETGILRIISPTDCVKDRLTWFYHDGDSQCLEQAVVVCQQNCIDLDEIERWSLGEGRRDLFGQIRRQLEGQT